jgi:hypothetical protein
MKIKLGPSTSLINLTTWVSSCIERTWTPLRESCNYLGEVFDKRITCKLHIEMIEAKAFRTLLVTIPYSQVSD